AQECFDLRALAAALRAELTNLPAVASIGPKVSVLIDSGGALHLDSVPGDLRLRAGTDSRLHLSMAGTAAASTSLGWIPADHALGVIAHLLVRIADRGPDARARVSATPAGVQPLRASLASVLSDAPPRAPRPPAEPIGVHPLNTGQLALGVAV